MFGVARTLLVQLRDDSSRDGGELLESFAKLWPKFLPYVGISRLGFRRAGLDCTHPGSNAPKMPIEAMSICGCSIFAGCSRTVRD
jgi:hypothetical protein